MRALAVAFCALLLVACGGSANKGPQDPRGGQSMATVDEAVALFVEMGEAVMSAGNDCDLMASKVGSWLDTNGERRKRINAALLRLDSAEAKDAYRQRLSRHLDVVQAMQAGIEGCQQHAAFARAWNRLDE